MKTRLLLVLVLAGHTLAFAEPALVGVTTPDAPFSTQYYLVNPSLGTTWGLNGGLSGPTRVLPNPGVPVLPLGLPSAPSRDDWASRQSLVDSMDLDLALSQYDAPSASLPLPTMSADDAQVLRQMKREARRRAMRAARQAEESGVSPYFNPHLQE